MRRRLLVLTAFCWLLAGSALAQGRRVASPRGHSATEVGGSWAESGRYVEGKWRIVQYNRAFLIPNEMVEDLVKKISELRRPK